MNLSEPLEGLTSKVAAAVLRVLSRTDAGLSGRQVHKVAGVGSTSSVHKALTDMVAVGLVTVESRPPSLIYRPNRVHVLWKAVGEALLSRDRAIEEIRLFFIDEVPDEVPEDWRVTATLYGSTARRDSTPQSDVDVLVVFPDGFDTDERADLALRLAERIEELTGNTAQVNTMDRGGFLRRQSDGDVFLANVQREGIHLFGPPPETWRTR
ncbi:nucleotidyltransferase family protein [Microbacterium sp. VKM Ac-2923]|uniref:nucleotidyltransferase family protein n=1 Tax=Microbacterium sp. VKM Ac-2923 TaxID=2929476 RepID=UPI001FB3EC8E|nr:nucleotidyltransferase domain-containing protein [Microbacterium sp. VKM Ac-2923]MCJ1709527.1 nucleotidyltransferase domain-containing protein [Microbacterium sp. VKM Ac-2923]